MNNILESKQDAFNIAFINCATLGEPGTVYGEVRGKLLGSPPNKKDDFIALQNAIRSADKKALIVLDESDNLSRKLLLNMFSLPELGACIIGVSNKPDQTYLHNRVFQNCTFPKIILNISI